MSQKGDAQVSDTVENSESRVVVVPQVITPPTWDRRKHASSTAAKAAYFRSYDLYVQRYRATHEESAEPTKLRELIGRAFRIISSRERDYCTRMVLGGVSSERGWRLSRK